MFMYMFSDNTICEVLNVHIHFTSLHFTYFSFASNPLRLHGNNLADGLAAPQLPAYAGVGGKQGYHGQEVVEDHEQYAIPGK